MIAYDSASCVDLNSYISLCYQNTSIKLSFVTMSFVIIFGCQWVFTLWFQGSKVYNRGKPFIVDLGYLIDVMSTSTRISLNCFILFLNLCPLHEVFA